MKSAEFLEAVRRLNVAAYACGLKPCSWGTIPAPQGTTSLPEGAPLRMMRRLGSGAAFIKVFIVGRDAAEVRADLVAGILAANDRPADDELAVRLLEEIRP